MIGEALVVEVPDTYVTVDEAFVSANVPPGTERVLFKTRNSAFWNEPNPQFHTDFTHLNPGAATWLRDHGAKLVGIDYLSIEKSKSPGHPTHVALLSHGIVIVEALNLSDVPPGRYELFCLPLKLRSDLGDGAPARAVLRTLD
jgi:arylformamidase